MGTVCHGGLWFKRRNGGDHLLELDRHESDDVAASGAPVLPGGGLLAVEQVIGSSRPPESYDFEAVERSAPRRPDLPCGETLVDARLLLRTRQEHEVIVDLHRHRFERLRLLDPRDDPALKGLASMQAEPLD